MTKPFCLIPTTHIVTEDMVRELLCTALEGGSNYWYVIDDYRFADGVTYADFTVGGRFGPSDGNYWHPSQLVPFHEGCGLVFRSNEADEIDDKEYFLLDRAAMERGMRLMSDKYPSQFVNSLDGDGDAHTADLWLQLALFGKIVFC